MKVIEKTIVGNELILKHNSLEIYNNGGGYLNQLRLFHAYHNHIPNIKTIDNLDLTKLKKWFMVKHQDDIQHLHFSESYDAEKKMNLHTDLFLVLKSGVLLNFFSKTVDVLFLPKDENIAQKLQESFVPFIIKRKRTKEISFIVNHPSGRLTTKEVQIKKPKIDFELHYNNDFKEIHASVIKNIKKEGEKGLYLFHGQPGTGKSTYIKYLIHSQNKQVIFLSPKLASNLDDLHLTDFLLDNPNCVLVIEDAEELILSRDNHQNTKLSFLLNLTDGLLAESLGIQIIATFNTDLKNIDNALLRKGRLTSIYEFKPLELQKTNNLLHKLGHDIHSTQEMTVADIYNIQKDNHHVPALRKAVGFGN
jgi:DNA replication protein DnaC